ncbi:hypothetical protein [Mucilaginibacter rubeus]|uniref:Uncharacterized protein n=1 Tax=Mucilaginibacter rubeus TaxID=2027860 RepID=A0A5C1I1D2_9SPHI|nr:hypothetical protein [Mucilaginibacter rubeus]QEM12017.1 hypothetical protein DEO27_018945 [Mucilaginibacter rubeus]
MYFKPILFSFIYLFFLNQTIAQEKHPEGVELSKFIKEGAGLYQRQFIIPYAPIGTCTDSNYKNAKLIRTGWDDGIFKTNPGYYRYDLASTVPVG